MAYRMMLRTVIAFVLVAIVAGGAVEAQELKMVKLSYARAADLLPVVKSFLSKDGMIIVDERLNAFMIKDNPESLAKVLGIISALDVKTPMVSLEVSFSGSGSRSLSGVDLSIYARSADKGTAAVVTGSELQSQAQYSSTGTYMVMATSGTPTKLLFSETVPVAIYRPLYDYAVRNGYLAQSMVIENVQSGFFAIPRVGAGDIITLDIMPGFSCRSQGNPLLVRFTAAQTSVCLKDGQPMTIGLVSGKEQALTDAIFGSLGMAGSSDFSITVTARIVDR
ncbi:MAG: secretin N-terminal domain-containing protein [Candidatus Eremiobacteraeota bacterium]|nr:secretin N-terminal domain-containing protein [Candidatus Eremiobacteraeota bacterium]